jgi:hypothetical protein
VWGQRLYKQGFAADALGKFEESWGLRALPVTAYNIAVCHEDLKREGQAIRWYREYLRRAPDASDKKDVLATMTALEKRLQKQGKQALVVITEPEAVDVEIGGQAYGLSPVVVTLPKGTHRVVARAKGLVTVERNVVLPDNTSVEVSLLLSPERTESRVDSVKADAPVMTKVEPAVVTQQATTTLTLQADEALVKLVKRERTAVPWVLLGSAVGLWPVAPSRSQGTRGRACSAARATRLARCETSTSFKSATSPPAPSRCSRSPASSPSRPSSSSSSRAAEAPGRASTPMSAGVDAVPFATRGTPRARLHRRHGEDDGRRRRVRAHQPFEGDAASHAGGVASRVRSAFEPASVRVGRV